MKLIKSISSLMLLVALASCQDNKVDLGTDRTVDFHTGITRISPDAETRTNLAENSKGGLDCCWLPSDVVLVTDGTGIIGSLTPVPGTIEKHTDGSSFAQFEGKLTLNPGITTGSALTFILPGKNYESENGVVSCAFSLQSGAVEGLGDHDMLIGSSEVTVAGADAWTEDMNMSRKVAFAHFQATGVDNIPTGGLEVTVSGTNLPCSATVSPDGSLSVTEGSISVKTDANGDFYLAFPVKEDVAISPVFTAVVDGEKRSVTLERENLWKAGDYVRKGVGKGIPVDFSKKGTDDGTTGPTIEYNGKKYRFAKGNLYYNTASKTWGIFDECTHFADAAQIIKASPASTATPEIIDHFSWGATGVDDAQDPVLTRDAAWKTSYSGDYFPTADTNKSRFITTLLNAEQEYTYDWGHAFMANGRNDKDQREYITPPLSVITNLFSNSFLQGCTIKNAGLNGESITGLIVIPKKLTLAEAKQLLSDTEGASYSSSMVLADHNASNYKFNYANITLDGVDVLDRLGNALFFAAAGAHTFNSGNTVISNSTKQQTGRYWTATAAQGTNAYTLGFCGNNSTSANNFIWYDGTKSSSNNGTMGRFCKYSVRLLVEVD